MKTDRRFWFEVPPFADVLDPAGQRWNVGGHRSTDTQVIVTNYDTPPRRIVRNIAPREQVTMALPNMGDALASLANAGFFMQVIDEGAM